MGKRIRIFFWLLTAVCLGYNFYVWGGLQATPVVGKRLMLEAPFQSPLAATYMFIGNKVNDTIGRTEQAREYAARQFPELVSNPDELKHLVVQRFLSAQSPLGTFCYYGAPILLVLSFVLHARRQKPIRSLGTGK